MESRRDFIKKASLITGALGITSIMPPAIKRALAINPEKGTSYLDAEHVVFLMQENRSFDHCFGSLKGVRGFNDPRALRLANEAPVWFQSSKEGKTFAPFRLNMRDTKATWMSSLPHSWTDQVDAFNHGKMDGWIAAKPSGNKNYKEMPLTMGYYQREDIPFYYALADAFTVCDQYFSSSLTGTSPNRCFFWSGTIRPEPNEHAQAHVWNDDIDQPELLTWTTYPERLQKAGVDWKIYQNELSIATGLNEEEDYLLSNFTDNTLECFKAYHVRLHKTHVTFLHKELARLEEVIKTLKDQTAPIGQLKESKKQCLKIKKQLKEIGNRTFADLSEFEKELHLRAFVTNWKDPHYHELLAFTYEEQGIKREMKIPKGDVLHQFRQDVSEGKLPTVSWLVAPCVFSDHPSAPWFGAWYVSEVMDILTKNPDIWKKTIFVLTYDENDGYFDHVPPFVPPNPNDAATGKVSKSIAIREEYVSLDQKQGLPNWNPNRKRESPIGLGYRVPFVVASPWTRGGFVNSQVFDHTSTLQFLTHFLKHKKDKVIEEKNISSWRKVVCGNLTSIFRPYYGENYLLPKTIKKNDFIEEIYNAKFKAIPQNFEEVDLSEMHQENKIPSQEKGTKDSCALPYELYVDGELLLQNQKLQINFAAGNKFFSEKSVGAAFKVYAPKGYPSNGKTEKNVNWSFAVAAGEQIAFDWDIQQFPKQEYELLIYGPNGFFRKFKGSLKSPSLQFSLKYEKTSLGIITGNVLLQIENRGLLTDEKLQVIDNAYGAKTNEITIAKTQKELTLVIDTSNGKNWYDFSVKSATDMAFEYQYAGRVETGKEGITDPQMAG